MKTLFTAIASAALLTAGAASAYASDAAASEAQYDKNIVETAAAAGSFNTLLTAATEAGLADTLANGGPFTVLAPTDAAFAALPEGTVENLLKEENRDQLRSILLLHVIEGEYPSSSVAGATTSVTALSGGTLNVDGTDGVTVNGANVIQADVEASNGVIHVIDAVILP